MKGTAGSVGGEYKIVAARAGTIYKIVDSFSENRPDGDPCNNNYVWIRHGTEWTKYSHLQKDSVRGTAGLREGDTVAAGRFLGYEDDVGCANGQHLHFEVAVPTDPADPINSQGFIKGTNRVPRMCLPYLAPPSEPPISHVTIGVLVAGRSYTMPPIYKAGCVAYR
jgi:hypothetical protein